MADIVGILNLNQKYVKPEDLERMIKVLQYRNFGQKSYFVDDNVGLGCCYHKSLNLLQPNKQLIGSKDQALWIVYDGEIYNSPELRKELEKYGHVFKSNTDMEIILHSYEQWGANCLDNFNGNWAFAIWDKKKKELFCSTDRFGIKPFYYFCNGSNFYFASTIKSLLELNIPREPNDVLICEFIKFSQILNQNETFFKNIKKLPAASWIRVSQEDKPVIKKYWDFEISNQIINDKKDQQEYVEEFLSIFIDSIKLRSRGTLPIGFLVSGGIDSSSIISLASNLLNEKLITFSISHKKNIINEMRYVEAIAAKINLEKNYIFPQVKNFPEGFFRKCNNVIWHHEEPFWGISLFLHEQVFKIAAEKVKVLLSGDGADEILCGYSSQRIIYFKNLLENHKYGVFFNEFTKFLFLDIFTNISDLISKNTNVENLENTLYFSKNLLDFPGLGIKFMEEDLLSPRLSKKFSIKKNNYKKDLSGYTKNLIMTWPLPPILNFREKMARAHLIELRYPFLDHRLVEKLASLPRNQIINNGWSKVILRKSMNGILPKIIQTRRKKMAQGFIGPEKAWIKIHLNKEIVPIIKKGYFIPDYVDKKKLLTKLNKSFSRLTLAETEALFKLYILELWGRKFIFKY